MSSISRDTTLPWEARLPEGVGSSVMREGAAAVTRVLDGLGNLAANQRENARAWSPAGTMFWPEGPPREQARPMGCWALALGGLHSPIGSSCFPLQMAHQDTPGSAFSLG